MELKIPRLAALAFWQPDEVCPKPTARATVPARRRIKIAKNIQPIGFQMSIKPENIIGWGPEGPYVKKRKRRSMGGELRRLFYEVAHGRCHYCQRMTFMPSSTPSGSYNAPLKATVDHVIPVSKGGAMKGDNCVLACAQCNGAKGNMMPYEWESFMLKSPNWWGPLPPCASKEYRGATPIKDAPIVTRYGRLPLPRGATLPAADADPLWFEHTANKPARQMTALETARFLRESAERSGKPWPLA